MKVDLDHLALSSGEARKLELRIGLSPIELGGQTYRPEGEGADAVLDISRTTTGYALRLRFDAVLEGPCVRCLTESRHSIEIDTREVDQAGAEDEELRSPYVSDGILAIGQWANDAVVLALPAQPLCREDCKGLCPVCGESLNDAPEGAHDHPSGGDPRMAKLRDLKLD
jgi:uncharacterized protein